MTTKKYNYLYIERMDGQPIQSGALYAKLFKTYGEAKSIFDHIVNDIENCNGKFSASTPEVPDRFITATGKIIEITIN